jgi:hypothetical protein
MSKRAGKSVLGAGDEFSWVGSEASASRPAGKTELQAPTTPETETLLREVESCPDPSAEPPESPVSADRSASSEFEVLRTSEAVERRPSGNGQKLGVYLQSATVRELKMQAIRENRSASAIVEQLVTEYCITQARLRS